MTTGINVALIVIYWPLAGEQGFGREFWGPMKNCCWYLYCSIWCGANGEAVTRHALLTNLIDLFSAAEFFVFGKCARVEFPRLECFWGYTARKVLWRNTASVCFYKKCASRQEHFPAVHFLIWTRPLIGRREMNIIKVCLDLATFLYFSSGTASHRHEICSHRLIVALWSRYQHRWFINDFTATVSSKKAHSVHISGRRFVIWASAKRRKLDYCWS